jgi:hypothetical protein
LKKSFKSYQRINYYYVDNEYNSIKVDTFQVQISKSKYILWRNTSYTKKTSHLKINSNHKGFFLIFKKLWYVARCYTWYLYIDQSIYFIW